MNEPQRGIGDNLPPEATYQSIVDRLALDYEHLATRAQRLVESADVMPELVRDEAMLQAFSNVIVALRDAVADVEAIRVKEKEPYLRSGQAVDGFFTTLKERLTRARTSLHRRVDAYKNTQLAIERERRRLEAEKAARDAQEARAREEAARREAEEARLAADRARSQREPKAAVADEKALTASQASAAAAIAADSAEKARIETLRSSAEIARSRFDDGRLVTVRRVAYVEITDIEKLDGARLWDYVPREGKEAALKAWAKATNYARSMPGAIVEMRHSSEVR